MSELSNSPAATPTAPDPGAISRTLLNSWGLFTAILLVMLGNGMLIPLLGIRAELEGFSTSTTGFVLGSYFAGFLLGGVFTRQMVYHVGHIRVYAALASLASTATLVYIITPDPVLWSIARMITGFAMSGLYIVAESWVVDASTPGIRGRMLAIYMVILMGGMGLGQLLLPLADPAGIVLFITGSILVSVAVIPITMSVSSAPDVTIPKSPMPIRRVWKESPLGLVAAFGQGVGGASFMSLAAVFGSQVGMTVNRIALFASMVALGSIALQAPVGSLSDKVGRRGVIAGTGLLAAGMCFIMVYTDHLSWMAIVMSFIIGGLGLCLYPLAISYINDRLPSGSATGVSSLMTFTTGVGAVIGPIAAAYAMENIGPEGLFWFIGVVYLCVTLYSGIRIITHEGIPVKDRRKFVMVPARASSVILHMARRRRRGKHVNAKSGSKPADR